MHVLAHISDTHFDNGERALLRARRVIAYLAGLPGRIDAILVSGDIADHGLPAEYAEARETLVAAVPVLILPGNHDRRAAFREVLLGEPADDVPVNQAHSVGGVRYLLCDSQRPGHDEGLLTDDTLGWLDAELAAGDEPAFVCLHHQPILFHQGFVDKLRLQEAERLEAVLLRHPRVVAVLCGHAHSATAARFAGRPVLIAPGVVSTVRLPWEGGVGPVDLDQPPGVAFHVLDDDGGLTTHFRVAVA